MTERQKDRLARCVQEVEEHPEHATAHYNLGLAYTVSSRIRQAEEAYLKAVELDAELVQAWVNLGGIRLMRWDFKGCLAANEEAVRRRPDLAQAHFNMGQAYLYLNDPANLLRCNQRVLELEPNHAAAHYFAAVARLAMHDVGAAERHMARANELGHSPPPDFIKALEKAKTERSRSQPTLVEITGSPDPNTSKED